MLKQILKSLSHNPNYILKEIKEKILQFVETPIYYSKGTLKIIESKIMLMPKYPVIRKLDNGIYFIFKFLDDHRILEMYQGTFHPHLVKCLKKYLKRGDVFIDVGANIGYFTAIGAGLVGLSGAVHSFEPVPIYFNILSKMARLNENYKIYVNNCALGDSFGSADIKISNISNIGWNTMVPSFGIKTENLKEILKVKVIRLDDYIYRRNIEDVSLIKIDVEGYEYPVLKGLINFFEQKKENAPNLIVEIMPPRKGMKDFDYTLSNLEKFMKKYNYRAHNIINEHPIDIKKLLTTTDVFFKQII